MVGLLCSKLVSSSNGICFINNMCARDTCLITSQVSLFIMHFKNVSFSVDTTWRKWKTIQKIERHSFHLFARP